MTNGDRIRQMADEDLAIIIMCPYDTAGEQADIMPCVKETGTMEFTKPGMCYECVKTWLQKEDT